MNRTIKSCLDADHKVTISRSYYGQDLIRVGKDGTIIDILEDRITGIEEESIWCDTCNAGFSERYRLDGEDLLAESLGDEV